MANEPLFDSIEAGPHRYPTPHGDIHVDRELDEITLMRLITAATDLAVEWRWVSRATVGLMMIGLEVIDHDGNRVVTDENNDPVRRWLWTAHA